MNKLVAGSLIVGCLALHCSEASEPDGLSRPSHDAGPETIRDAGSKAPDADSPDSQLSDTDSFEADEPGYLGPSLKVQWEPCSFVAQYPPTSTSSTVQGQCALVHAPLNYADPSGPRVGIHVKRLLSGNQPARSQLWMLNGGPGYASTELEPQAIELAGSLADFDVYLTDFRGVGKSTSVSCEAETFDILPSEVPTCAAEVASKIGSLQHFTTTSAATDLAQLIASTHTAGQTRFVVGFSFGTFWAHRFMQLYPSLADGIVLDSIVSPDADFSTYGPDAEVAVRDLFTLCGKDETCSSKLGTEPWGRVEEFFARPASDACPTRYNLSQAFYESLIINAVRKERFREIAPAFVYRLLRCDADDQKALVSLVDAIGTFPSEPDADFSLVLHKHVVLSELWPDSPKSADEYEAIDDSLLLAPTGAAAERRLWDVWPKTPKDRWAAAIAKTEVPLLMMHGGLDPQAPKSKAEAFATRFTRPNQTFVFFPLAPHGILFQTPITSDPTKTCGSELLRRFVSHPRASLVTDCVARVRPIDFGDHPELASWLFNQPSIWEATGPSPEGAVGETQRQEAARGLRSLASGWKHR